MLPLSQIMTLVTQEGLDSTLSLSHLVAFFELVSTFRPLITIPSARRHAHTTPPLPSNVRDVIAIQLDLPADSINRLWLALGAAALSSEIAPINVLQRLDRSLRDVGPSHGTGIKL